MGTIRSSNLCTEIMEFTSKDEVAVCNLASIALPMFVKADKTFDFDKLVQGAPEFSCSAKVLLALFRSVGNGFPGPRWRKGEA